LRYFLHIAYSGTNYSGWQRQPNAPSVQQTIEESISKILKHKVYVHGCGRTDSGVHASQYFLHFDFHEKIKDTFVRILNLTLPSDISCFEMIPMADKAHAQYDAKIRTYEYHIHLKKIPLLSETSAYYPIEDLNYSLIQEAINILKNTEDFRSLCKTPDIYKHTRCTIHALDMDCQNNRIKFTIKANRYLRSMIRLIVARLLEIGEGKLTLDKFGSTLVSLQSFEHPYSMKAHPQGLYLSKIEYDYLIRDNYCQ